MSSHEISYWHLEVSGDGTRDSFLIQGTPEDAKRALVYLLWLGTYEEGIQNEEIQAWLAEFDDPDEWSMCGGVFKQEIEQGWIRVSRVVRKEILPI